MTKFDLKYIDDFFKPDIGLFELQDSPEQDIIEKISQNINENKRNFMFIVKRGVHFHYENMYPQGKKYFQPTLSKNEPISFEKKEKTINSYMNGIRWKVDDFFKQLFLKINIFDRNDTVIIYTSDHGQSILEGNSVSTHAVTVNPYPTQGIVPLLIFAPNISLFNQKETLLNHYSHFQIFPTILELMGYKQIESTLFDTNSTIDQRFFSGDLFGRAKTSKTYTKKMIQRLSYE